MKNRRLTQEQREEAVRRYVTGSETVAEIARSLGVSNTTIRYHADRHEAEPRYGRYYRTPGGVFGTLTTVVSAARRVFDTNGQDPEALTELGKVLDSFKMGA